MLKSRKSLVVSKKMLTFALDNKKKEIWKWKFEKIKRSVKKQLKSRKNLVNSKIIRTFATSNKKDSSHFINN
jgi:hypothetical protein